MSDTPNEPSSLRRLGAGVRTYRARGEATIVSMIGGALTIRVTSAILTYGTVVLLANWMDPLEFGRMAFGLSLAMALSLFAGLGQPLLVLRFVAAYRGKGQPELVRELLRFSVRRTAFGSILASTLPVGVYFLGGVADMRVSGTYLLAVAPLAGLLTVAEFQSHLLRGFGAIGGALLPRDVLWRPVVLAALAFLSSPKAVTVLAIFAGVLAVFLSCQYVLIVRPTIDRLSTAEEVPSAARGVANAVSGARVQWRETSGRLWIVSALTRSLQHLAVVAAGVSLDPALTGAFFGAVRTAAMLALPLQGVNLVVAPRMAHEYAASGAAKVQRLANTSVAFSGGMAGLGFVLLVLGGQSVLRLMNDGYVAAYAALLIAGGGYLISALNGSSGMLLVMTGRERIYVRLLLVSSVIALSLMSTLPAVLGMSGAALGYAVGLAGWNVAASYWARRNIGVDPSIVGLVSQPDLRGKVNG